MLTDTTSILFLTMFSMCSLLGSHQVLTFRFSLGSHQVLTRFSLLGSHQVLTQVLTFRYSLRFSLLGSHFQVLTKVLTFRRSSKRSFRRSFYLALFLALFLFAALIFAKWSIIQPNQLCLSVCMCLLQYEQWQHQSMLQLRKEQQ